MERCTHRVWRFVGRCCVVWLGLVNTIDAATVQDPDFVVEQLHSGNGMISVVFEPQGRMYVAEKSGRILVFRPDPVSPGSFLAPTEFACLEDVVDDKNERGLLGFALHPLFASNRWMYVFYSAESDQRLVRITADVSLEMATTDPPELILGGLPNESSSHNAGDIRFHPTDDSLFITLGDDHATDVTQDLNSYEGKILRVDDNGFGLIDNPHFDGDVDSIPSRIWGSGCRNPFRFAFHPATNVLYVSENGDGVDRVSRWTAGANGEWPDEFTSSNDPRVTHLLTPDPSITGIAIVRGGPFADPTAPGSDALYVANYGEDNIRRWRLTGDDLDTAVPINISDSNEFIADLDRASHISVGPDNSLYVTTTGRSTSTGALYRVRFVGTGGQMPADCNQDGVVNLGDALCVLDFLFGGSGALPCGTGQIDDPSNVALIDTNDDATIDLADAVATLVFLFGGGAPPPLGTECVDLVGCPAVCVLSN